MLHSTQTKFPIDQITQEILHAVSEAAALAGIDSMVVGATARDIILTHVFGIPLQRATNDVDFAVAVESWEQFEQLKFILSSKVGFEASDRMKQRLYYGGEKKERGHPIDLVPFGGVAQGGKEIVWPPDMMVTMNVAGYQEVLSAAQQVRLAPDLIVRVASLPGLAILKMIAWTDRRAETSKDAQDLYYVMTKYADAGNTDRLFEAEMAMLEAAGFDSDVAGACLLGKDVACLANDETYQQLVAILDQQYDRLSLDMSKSLRNDDDAQTRIETRLQQFKAGMLMR